MEAKYQGLLNYNSDENKLYEYLETISVNSGRILWKAYGQSWMACFPNEVHRKLSRSGSFTIGIKFL